MNEESAHLRAGIVIVDSVAFFLAICKTLYFVSKHYSDQSKNFERRFKCFVT